MCGGINVTRSCIKVVRYLTSASYSLDHCTNMALSGPKQTRFYIDDTVRERLEVLLTGPPMESDHVTRILVPVPQANESKDVSNAWIKCFGRWAAQEGLSDDLALLLASDYMQQCDYSWAHQFSVGHTWEGFVRRYFQRTVTSDLQVAEEVESYLAWFRNEYRGYRRKTAAVIRFSQRELAKATEFYSAMNVIGEGGFGTVYRGHLPDFSGPVAVKRLRLMSRELLYIINAEVGIISQFKHSHVLRLIGWSLGFQDPVLVYEFLPNGNLREHLDGLRGLKLNWGTRMKIAIEIAQALTYLHDSLNTIHRDVKSTHILLDEFFAAKLSGFGISKSLPTDCSLSALPVGSPGYVDPYYLVNYDLTMKSDVYSFGVVLLELVSGMPVVDTRRPRNKLTLAALAISRVKNHRLSELFEPYLIQTGAPLDLKQWKKVALLALQCVRMEPEARPCIKEVLDTLRELRPMFAHNYPPAGTTTLFLPRACHKPPVTEVESSLKFLAWGSQQFHRNLLLPVELENGKQSDDTDDKRWTSESVSVLAPIANKLQCL